MDSAAAHDLMDRDWPAGRRPLEMPIVDLRPIATPPAIATKMCPNQHPNNPDAGRCTTCRREIAPAAPVVTMKPRAVARLLLEDGTGIDVASRLVVGRSPVDVQPDEGAHEETSSHLGSAQPNSTHPGSADTLRVTGRQVSRRHLMLDVDGWQLVIRDAGSTNGTFLSRPGEQGRRRVPDGRSVPVHVGDSIHFGSRQALVVHAR